MIFDRFPSRQKAEEFVETVCRDFNLQGWVFDDEESASLSDEFPYRLEPPIVHIERSGYLAVEQGVRDCVEKFGGRFAGT